MPSALDSMLLSQQAHNKYVGLHGPGAHATDHALKLLHRLRPFREGRQVTAFQFDWRRRDERQQAR